MTWKKRSLLDQREVDPDIEGTGRTRELRRVGDRPPDRQDGGRGENAPAMRLEDALVNPRSQTEVVCVDDEPGRHMAAEKRCFLRSFLPGCLSVPPSRPSEMGSARWTDLVRARPFR